MSSRIARYLFPIALGAIVSFAIGFVLYDLGSALFGVFVFALVLGLITSISFLGKIRRSPFELPFYATISTVAYYLVLLSQ